jgi:hypothetical protein
MDDRRHQHDQHDVRLHDRRPRQHRATKRLGRTSENRFVPFDNDVGRDSVYFPGVPLLGFAFTL